MELDKNDNICVENSSANTITTDIYIVDGDNYTILTTENVGRYIELICQELKADHLDVTKITKNVYPKLKTVNMLDDVKNQVVMCASEMVTDHYDYPRIATWILINDLHQKTHDNYLLVVQQLYSNINKIGKAAPIVSTNFYNFVLENYQKINSVICYDRDYDISIFGYRTLEKSYLKKMTNGQIIERPQHLYMRVSIALHYRNNDLEKIWETYDLLSNGYFTHATPTLFNAGTTHEQLASCFLLGLSDDMECIGDCWRDCAVISKYSGGIGIHATNIRVNGAYINSTQGTASGLRLLTVFNQIARYADQGGKRAGSIAIYIEPWHGDIFFFLELKKNTGAETERARDLFLALMVNDIFMKRVEDNGVWSLMCPSLCPDLLDKYGTEFTTAYEKYESEHNYLKQIPARDLWFKIMETQIETGVPYIVFKDAVNYKSNQINIGVVNGSNLCVAGDTLILTSTGYHPIKSLDMTDINVWNGESFSKTTVRKTGSDQELLEIEFSNGSVLKCTPYHKFYLLHGSENQSSTEVRANNLKIGDRLIKSEFPVIRDGLTNFKYPYTHGDYGDLNINQNKITTRPYHNDKYTVPINYDLNIKLRWLEGLLDNDGCVAINGSNKSLQITSIHKSFLNEVKLMLQTLGCDPKVTISSTRNKSLLPNGIEGMNLCDENPTFMLLVHSNDTYNLVQLGLNPKRLYIADIERPQQLASQFITVTKITKLDQREDTYCFTETKRGTGIFNGVITGQCAEILEVSTASEYSVCTLSSICLPKFIVHIDGKPKFDYDLLYKVTRTVTHNTNNVIDINFYPVDKTRVSNLKHRPIGIGVQGLADVFAIMRTPFDSDLAKDINKKIFETIYFAALTESMTIAKTEGPYSTFAGSPLSKGLFQFDLWGVAELSGMWDWETLRKDIMHYGVRNSLVTACMPTASTSQIRNNNEMCEPYTENIYTRQTLAGDYYVINRHLMKDLIELGVWNEDIVDLIKYYKGSVANIPNIPAEIKQIYRTVWEIPQKSIIDMAADRGPFVDQTQSMNIFIAKASFARLNSCLFHAWKSGLKTGIYYLRSKAASDANQFGIDINKIKELEEKYGIVIDTETINEVSDDDIIVSEVATGPIRQCRYEPGCLSCGS